MHLNKKHTLLMVAFYISYNFFDKKEVYFCTIINGTYKTNVSNYKCIYIYILEITANGFTTNAMSLMIPRK